MNKKSSKNSFSLKVILISLCIILLLIIFILLAKPGLLYRLQGIWLRPGEEYTDFSEINLDGNLLEYDLNQQHDWTYEQSLILVNQKHHLPQDFVPQMSEYKDSGVEMNVAILDAYAQLSGSVTAVANDSLFVSSVYRDASQQEELYLEDPIYALPPGQSEHQTGLALDVYVFEHAGMTFLESEAGQYVNQNCYDFGFIIRYPEDKENITGIPFEPWHLRYVGLPHSQIIRQNFIVFEEYIEMLEPGKYYRYGNYLITRQRADSRVSLPDNLSNIVCSPDNTNHLIITAEYP